MSVVAPTAMVGNAVAAPGAAPPVPALIAPATIADWTLLSRDAILPG